LAGRRTYFDETRFLQAGHRAGEKYGHNQMVGNGLQTNGMLLDKNWASFLKEFYWLVCISLDDPEHIHNRYRFGKGQKGAHQRVEENAIMLLQEGVAANSMC
jgi:uncharacterized protein